MTRNDERALDLQGYGDLPPAEKRRCAVGLRFTPAACTSLVVLGLVLESPLVLALTAIFALIGSVAPRAHPLDLLYDRVVRRLVGGPVLPPTPAPRRFAAGIKSVPLFVAAAALEAGYPELALAIGAFLVGVGAVAAITFWDLGSWLYWAAERRFGKLVARGS